MGNKEFDQLRRLLIKTPLVAASLMATTLSASAKDKMLSSMGANTHATSRLPSVSQTLLLKNADVVVTMDDKRREIKQGCVYIKGNTIVSVGTVKDVPQTADRIIDLNVAPLRGEHGSVAASTVCKPQSYINTGAA